MKSILSILLIVFSITVSAQQDDEGTSMWLTNYDKALAESEATGKLIMIEFAGSDWCSNCRRIKKMLFDTDEFKAYAKKHLVLLMVDKPMRKQNQLSPEQEAHNKKLFEKYNKQGVFPTVLFLNHTGEVVERLEYPQQSLEDYMAIIKSVVETHQ